MQWSDDITVNYAASPPSDTTPPVKVTGLTVTPVSTSQLNLAWNKNPESDVLLTIMFTEVLPADLA